MVSSKRPYFLTDTIDLTASAAGQAVLRVGSNEKFEGYKIFIISTGTFSITGMTDDSGLPFTNADAGDPLVDTMFPDGLDSGVRAPTYGLSSEPGTTDALFCSPYGRPLRSDGWPSDASSSA